jgi:hypothetical protein
MHFSCVLAPTLRSPEHIAVAEQLGYARAWLFDTPQQSPDVWMTLGRAAELTDTIGLGPGVLVPSLRLDLGRPGLAPPGPCRPQRRLRRCRTPRRRVLAPPALVSAPEHGPGR